MGTLFLNEANLLAIVEQLTVRASWAVAAASIGAKEATMYDWLSRSRKAEKSNDESSPFFLTWRQEATWWHRHCARARKDNLLSLSALVADQLKCGTEELMYDPSTGRPLPALDPQWLGIDDEAMVAVGADPIRDRWLWRRDEITDEKIEPIWQTRKVEMPASLKATVLRGLLPRTFGEKAEVTHNLNAAVVHTVAPAPYVTIAERRAIESQKSGDVVDASFEEVKPERPDIAALRAEWNARQANPNKITQPRGSVVLKGDGTPVGSKTVDPPDDKPLGTRPATEHPRAYTQDKPPQREPRPPSGYPSRSDPTRPGAVAMRVLK
jgi:hypothetical protein